jgi:SAM-dependent methyltransferase
MTQSFYRRDLAVLHNLYYAEFVEGATPEAISLLRSQGIRRGVVLDLGCGGGQLSARLHAAGYSPVGLDVSAAMLRLARQQVPQAEFIRGSIATARLPQASAAIAVGEVFNYLRSDEQMLRAFRNVFRALQPGGVLLFDFKVPLPGKGKKTRTAARWGDDWAVVAEVEEDPERNKLIRKIVTFKKSGKSYRREDETHVQRIVPEVKMRKLAAAAGFKTVILTGYGEFKLPPDRKVIVAARRA